MAEIKHVAEIFLTIERCHSCGRHWALERYASGDCPACARRKTDQRDERVDSLLRTVKALRGALTKAKRGRR